MVGLPGSFLRVLLELEQWLTGRDPEWLPLSLLFEVEPVEVLARRPGPELFERFLAEFVSGAAKRRAAGGDGAIPQAKANFLRGTNLPPHPPSPPTTHPPQPTPRFQPPVPGPPPTPPTPLPRRGR